MSSNLGVDPVKHLAQLVRRVRAKPARTEPLLVFHGEAFRSCTLAPSQRILQEAREKKAQGTKNKVREPLFFSTRTQTSHQSVAPKIHSSRRLSLLPSPEGAQTVTKVPLIWSPSFFIAVKFF